MKDKYSLLYDLMGEVTDPRSKRGIRHTLSDVIFILLVSVISGIESADNIEDFVEENLDWFSRYCELRHGVPSQDTYLRLLAMIRPEAFKEVFQVWMKEIWGDLEEPRHISIDGKTLRRSFHRAVGQPALHSVAAFVSDLGLVIGQESVNVKENEIIAIPRLLKVIDLKGATVTIDAMGCQTAIAREIIDGGGDYLLQVKGNQPTLKEQIEDYFDDVCRSDRAHYDPRPKVEESVEIDGDHGRIEERTCLLSHDLSWIDQSSSWAKLSAIARIERRCEDKQTGVVRHDMSYYIVSNTNMTAAEINHYARSHWAIENSLHWVLDVTFNEDQSRVRSGYAAENLAIIRRLSLNLLRTAPSPSHKKTKQNVSIARRRQFCLMSPTYREKVLRVSSENLS
jgi:predicted transposase YbfD/YdcC